MKYTVTSLTLAATLVAGCGSSSSTPDSNDNNQPDMPAAVENGTDQGAGSDANDGAGPDLSTGGGSMPGAAPDVGTGDGSMPGAAPDDGVSIPVSEPEGGTSTPAGVVQDGNLTDSVQQVGFINIVESPALSSVDVSGFFIQLESPVQGDEVVEVLQTSRQEQCIVTEFETSDSDFFESDDLQFTNVSAGNVITLSGPTGTYGELVEQALFGFTTYISFSPLPFPAPNPLSIDIPGAVFPAYSAVQVTAAAQLNNQSLDEGDSLTAATTLTWDTATIGDARIVLNASRLLANETTVDLDCVIADDGSFTLPATTVSELDSLLGGSGWSMKIYLLERVSQVIQSSGNSVLLITREASDD